MASPEADLLGTDTIGGADGGASAESGDTFGDDVVDEGVSADAAERVVADEGLAEEIVGASLADAIAGSGSPLRMADRCRRLCCKRLATYTASAMAEQAIQIHSAQTTTSMHQW